MKKNFTFPNQFPINERSPTNADYQDFIKLTFSSNKYQFQGITPEIAELSTQLSEDINKDPADRIIAATSYINDRNNN